MILLFFCLFFFFLGGWVGWLLVGGLIPVFYLGGTVLEVPAPVRLHLSLVYNF